VLASDGTPEQRIRAAGERLRIGLPAAMREYYLAAREGRSVEPGSSPPLPA